MYIFIFVFLGILTYFRSKIYYSPKVHITNKNTNKKEIKKLFEKIFLKYLWNQKSIQNIIMEAIEQSNATIPGGILVDALPYIDHGYDEPGVREAVRFFLY